MAVLLLITGYCLQLKMNGAVDILFESWANDSLQGTLKRRTNLERNEVITVISKDSKESIFVNFVSLCGPALSPLLPRVTV
jgi:hypothetical protein